MTTFSAFVDSMLMERRRPDRQEYIINSLNGVIRDVHTPAGTGGRANAAFEENRHEVSIPVTENSGFNWRIPSPASFQGVEAARSRAHARYIEPKSPRIAQKITFAPYENLFYYRSTGYLVFSGVSIGDTIDLAYFAFPRPLAYLEVAERRVIYDVKTGEYLTPEGGIPTDEEMLAETNWLLMRWPNVLRDGVRTAVLRDLGDERSRLFYSSFETGKAAIWSQESSVQLKE